MLTSNIYSLPLSPGRIHEGKGDCLNVKVFRAEQFKTPVRFVNYTVLPPRATFGLHRHGDDNEIYVVLSGEGVYTENGASVPVKKGSIMVNAPFGEHGLENTGGGDMELLVLEVYNR